MTHALELLDRCDNRSEKGEEPWAQSAGRGSAPLVASQPQRLGLVSRGLAEERSADRPHRLAALFQAPKAR